MTKDRVSVAETTFRTSRANLAIIWFFVGGLLLAAVELAFGIVGGIPEFIPTWARLLVVGLICAFCLFLVIRLQAWHRMVTMRVGPRGIWILDVTKTTVPWSDILSVEIIDDRLETLLREPRGLLIQINTRKADLYTTDRNPKASRNATSLTTSIYDYVPDDGSSIVEALMKAIRPYAPVTMRTIR